MPIPTYLDQDDCDSVTAWIDTSAGQVTANTADGIYYAAPSSFKVDPDGASGGWFQKMVDDPFDNDGVIYSLEYWVYFPSGWAASATTGLFAYLPSFSTTAAGGNTFQSDLYVSKVGSDVVINEGDLDLVVPEGNWIHCFNQWTNDGGTTTSRWGAGYSIVGVSSDAAWGSTAYSTPGWDKIGPGFPLFSSDDMPVFYIDLIRMSKVALDSPGGCGFGEWTNDFSSGAQTADWEYDPGNDTGAPAISAGQFVGEYGNGSNGWSVRRGYISGGIYGDVWQKYDLLLPSGFWNTLWNAVDSGNRYVLLPCYDAVGAWDGYSLGSEGNGPTLFATSAASGQIRYMGHNQDLLEETSYEIIIGICATGDTSRDFTELWIDGVQRVQLTGTNLVGTATGGVFGAIWCFDQGYPDSPALPLDIDNWHWSPCTSLRPTDNPTFPVIDFIPRIIVL